jgi:hypothetical protein
MPGVVLPWDDPRVFMGRRSGALPNTMPPILKSTRTRGAVPLLLAVCLVSALLSGCSPKFSTTVVFRDSRVEVRLRHANGPDRMPVDQGYGHPATFSEEDMARLLGSVMIRYQRGFIQKMIFGKQPGVVPAFSEDEIDLMVPALVKAFAEATPSDRVELVFQHRSAVFSAGTTTGVLYVKDGKLNVIIPNYRAYNNQPETTTPGGRYRDPMERMGKQTHTLVAGPHQELHPSEDPNLEDRWLVIDAPALLAAPPEAPRTAPEARPENGIEEKLDTLKRLLDKGLITQDEYDAKKKELLEHY